MTSYPIFGTGHPIIKVYNPTPTLISTVTMSSDKCIMMINKVFEEKNDIEYTNVNKKFKVRKGIRRFSGIIELHNIDTTVLDALRTAYDNDGVYGYRIELQPFSGNTAFKLDVHFTATILPRNEGDKVYGQRIVTIEGKAESASIAYSTIKKYS